MQRAFSLVELSIVLVILGLLTGGILAGQSLIRASELRAVTSEYQRYAAASKTFRDKYFALPGDMTNATSFWGIAAGATGNDGVCSAQASTDARTCNGNGNGMLNPSTGSEEYLRVWQHMANAGLIEGSYNGIVVAPYYTSANSPSSKLSSGLWITDSSGNYAGGTMMFAGNYGNGLLLLPSSFSVSTAGSFSLKPEEAWNIDTKMDDGKPGTGAAVPYKGNGTNTNCTTGAGVAPPGDNAATATYVLTNSSKDCALVFMRVF